MLEDDVIVRGSKQIGRSDIDLKLSGATFRLDLINDDLRRLQCALNFIGADALYGRYWGALIDKRFLHFELCYYQAIDAAIALGLKRVEAGAQGGHKLARGYEPVRTYSAHYIAHESFREAVAEFLEREKAGVSQDQLYLGTRTPFRKE